jgi:hypothetical protein
LWRLLDNVEKYGGSKQARDNNTLRRRKYTIRMTDNYSMYKDTHSEYLNLIIFPRQQCLR